MPSGIRHWIDWNNKKKINNQEKLSTTEESYSDDINGSNPSLNFLLEAYQLTYANVKNYNQRLIEVITIVY